MASPLESALRLAGEGMYLFPLRPGDKKPIIADWPRLATCEPSTIHRWAREYRNCNWGILCGRQSGIWVLDCDRKNGSDGMATLRQYWDISWARTFTVRTPHNGVQFYYAYSDDLGEIRNQNPLLPGVDVRGQGGYVVAVGSVLISCDIPGCRCHPSEYRILVDRPFNASVKARRFYFAHRRTGQSEAPPPSTNGRFPIGQRNSALFRMALAMHQAHMTPEVILDGALRMNREHFDPPLPEHEVASLVDRVIKYSAPPRVVIGGSPDSLDEKLVSVDQALAAAHPEPDWLVDHLFPSASILAIVAMIKTGKTTFLLDVIRHLLNGEPWCGLHTKRTAVIYLTEQSPVSFNTELQLAGIGAGAAMRILYRPEVIKFGWLSVAKRVIEWVARFECGLVVVDTLTRWADLVGEGESHAGSVKIINCLESVLATGCSLALVYHSGKDGDNRVVENAIRGSSAWGGAADQIYRLRRPHGNQRDNCRILESSGRYNHLIAEKLGLRFVDDRYEITSRKEVEKIATGAINQLLDNLPTSPDKAVTLAELLAKSSVGRGTAQRAVKARQDVLAVIPPNNNLPVRYYRSTLPTEDSKESSEFGQGGIPSPLEPPSISSSGLENPALERIPRAPAPGDQGGFCLRPLENVGQGEETNGQGDDWEGFVSGGRMSITALLLRLRAKGGDVRLGPDDCLQVRQGSIKSAAWQVWKKRLKQDTAGVIAVLREERATRYWEASGRDPQWWRTYPYARTAVAPSCRCDALPFSHVHLDPGPAPNLELLPGEDVWQKLKLLISEVPERVW